MEPLRKALLSIQHVPHTVNVYVSIIVIFSYHFILDRNLHPKCKGHKGYCWTFITLPVFIIMVLLLWMNRAFQRAWNFTFRCDSCSKKRMCNSYFHGVLVSHVVKALLVGMLWPAAALLDVEWYLSCYCYCEVETKDSSCLQDSAEQLEEMKAYSKMCGLILLLSVVICAASMTLCNHKRKWRAVAGEMVLEEAETPTQTNLRNAVKNVLKQKLEAHAINVEWEESFDLAENLVISLLNEDNDDNKKIEGLEKRYRIQDNHQENNNPNVPEDNADGHGDDTVSMDS